MTVFMGELLQRATQLYRSGKTLNSVATEMNTDAGSVRYSLLKSGIALRTHGVREMTVPILHPVDAAYLAGIVDGEGSIELHRSNNRKPWGRVQIWNTSKPLIDWILKTIRTGTVTSRIRHGKVNGTKPCYCLEIASRQNVYAVLKQILPYMKIKSPKAQELIDYYELNCNRALGAYGYCPHQKE